MTNLRRHYRIWCYNCSEWNDIVEEDNSSEVYCPICDAQAVDVSSLKFMIIGHPVTNEILAGSHIFEMVPKGDRWIRHSGNVQFISKLSFLPSNIKISNLVTDGAGDLVVTKINKNGFEFSITCSANQYKKGMSMVSFDWEVER